MIALVAGLAWAAPIGLERVDVLSEDPGTWLSYEAPRATTAGRVVAIRFITQIKPVWFTPVDGLTVGTSLQAQTVHYERPLAAGPWSAGGGVVTRLGLPRGVVGGVAWRGGPVRVGVALNALSSATWARPDWSVWRVLPGVGIGIGRTEPDLEVWMLNP